MEDSGAPLCGWPSRRTCTCTKAPYSLLEEGRGCFPRLSPGEHRYGCASRVFPSTELVALQLEGSCRWVAIIPCRKGVQTPGGSRGVMLQVMYYISLKCALHFGCGKCDAAACVDWTNSSTLFLLDSLEKFRKIYPEGRVVARQLAGPLGDERCVVCSVRSGAERTCSVPQPDPQLHQHSQAGGTCVCKTLAIVWPP